MSRECSEQPFEVEVSRVVDTNPFALGPYRSGSPPAEDKLTVSSDFAVRVTAASGFMRVSGPTHPKYVDLVASNGGREVEVRIAWDDFVAFANAVGKAAWP